MSQNFKEIVLDSSSQIDLERRSASTVEVIILSHNSSKWISDCIKSVQAQQCSLDLSLTIHDDASTDDTCEIVREITQEANLPTTLLRQKQNAYSRGGEFYFELLANSSSPYVAVLDGDDYWLSNNKIQKQYEEMVESGATISYHDYVAFTGPGHRKPRIFPSSLGLLTKDFFYSLAAENPIGTSTVMIKTQALLELNMLGSGEHPFLDFPIWAQLAAISQPVYVPKLRTAYRIHNGGVSRGKGWTQMFSEAKAVGRWLAPRISLLGKSKGLWLLFASTPVRALWIFVSRLLARRQTIELKPDFLGSPRR